MKKGLLVALFGLALVATLALPQTASAQDYGNTATIIGFEGSVSGTMAILVIASATVSVRLPATFTMTKLVFNDTQLIGPASVVQAFSGDTVIYTVDITNNGTEDVLAVDFTDQINAVGLALDIIVGDCMPGGRLICNAAGLIEDNPANPIMLAPSGQPGDTVTLTYTATVN